jgi:CRP/FNR family transcriptional regulator, cyclic AMP receptor protein
MEPHKPDAIAPVDLESVFATRGWLAGHPDDFRALIISSGVSVTASRGKTVFREGDTSNGLYGIVSGSVGVEGGHKHHAPLMGHILHSGEWFGIKAVLDGGPRELTYRALEATKLLFVSNARLLPIMQGDPAVAIRIGQLAELGNRLGAWVTRDLLTPDAGKRLAAVLVRVLGMGNVHPNDPAGFYVTHQQLGEMANLSRHHVGRKLATLEAAGWIVCGYNRIRLLDAKALAAFAYAE